MEREDTSAFVNMSSNNTKFNLNAPAFVPPKKEFRQGGLGTIPVASPAPDQRINDNMNKKNKQRMPKTSRQREGNGRSQIQASSKDLDKSLHDPFEEQILNGKMKPNSRRGQISINHLLDFSLPETHDSYGRSNAPPLRRERRRKSSGNYGPKIHLVGERYINVNYKFVLDHRGDYRPQILDTNLPVEKKNILRVIIPKNDTQCPICLSDELVAPRMTSCGHCFCLTCLLRYLASEDPVPPKKNEPVKSQPKLKECPLCSKKIKPTETLPVLINPIDERFETPKIGEEAILQLMHRPHNKILAYPYQLKLRDPEMYNGNIPWFTSSDSHKYDPNDVNITGDDLFQYSRLMKAGSNFAIDNLLRERKEISVQFKEDQALYSDDGVFYKKAIAEIDAMIHETEVASVGDRVTQISLNTPTQIGADVPLEELTQRQLEQSEFNDSNTFFFYQTSFNSKTKFFVSALDNKILKTLYGSYSNFPLCLKIKIENIVFDYVVNDELIKRFKFMSYLPHGTEIAMLELDWFEASSKGARNISAAKRKSILPAEVFQQFKKEIVSRSDKIRAKNFKEEKSRLRYQDELELRTKEFYANENNFTLEDYGVTSYNKFDSLRLSDTEDGDLPPLLAPHEEGTDSIEETQYKTTVWGTKIAKVESEHEEEDDGDDYFNELLRQSREKEEKKKAGKKGRKKLVLLSTSK